MGAPRGFFTGEFIGKHQPKYKATGEFRAPKRGEYYLSGAIVAAYKAHNDLTSAYWIAVPVELKTCPTCNGSGKVEKKS